MLHMCNDLLKACDDFSPCPTYSGDMEGWLNDFDEYFTDSFPPDEIESVRMESSMRFVKSVFRAFMLNGTSGDWATLTVEERLAHIERLATSNQVAQRTPEWYSQSKLMLTASEFSNILGTPRAVATLALQKVAPVSENSRSKTQACCTPEMGPFDWGIRFEPVVKQVMDMMGHAKILDIGRIIHPENSRLAASPDGIITAADDERRIGRLIEIKCPVKRVIDGTIPHEYWCQMQIQMEVTGIDECEYVEMSFESGYKDHSYTLDSAQQTCSPDVYSPDIYDVGEGRPMYSGYVWLFQEPETLELKYAYTYLEKKDMERDGWFLLEEIPWHLKKFYRTVIVRDRAWFKGTAEKQEEFWKRVEDARAGLIEPPKKRAEKVIVQVCKIIG